MKRFNFLSIRTFGQLLFWGMYLILFCHTFPSLAQTTITLKILTVAPDNSPLNDSLKAIVKDIKTQTGGTLDFRITTIDNENRILQKLQQNEAQIAALSAIPLKEIVPQISVFEVPFVLQKGSQADLAYARLESKIATKFLNKSFTLLAFGDAGFTRFFTKDKPISTANEFIGLKLGLLTGDSTMTSLYKHLGIDGMSLDKSSILNFLRAQNIEGITTTAYELVSNQWHSQVNKIPDIKIFPALHGIIINSASLEQLSSNEKLIVKDCFKRGFSAFTMASRSADKQIMDILLSTNMAKSAFSSTENDKISQIGRRVGEDAVTASIYSNTWLTEVLNAAADAVN